MEGEVVPAAKPGAKPDAVLRPLGVYNYRRIRITDPWLDPPNKPVVDAESEVAFNYNLGCSISDSGLCALYSSGSFYIFGFPLTGWFTNQQSAYAINGGGSPQAYVGEGGTGVAYNAIFPTCTVTDPAWVFFVPTEVYGYGDGTYDGYSGSSVAGTCSNLLHHGMTYFTVLVDF